MKAAALSGGLAIVLVAAIAIAILRGPGPHTLEWVVVAVLIFALAFIAGTALRGRRSSGENSSDSA